MVLQDGETFINKEAPAMLQGLDEQIKVRILGCALFSKFLGHNPLLVDLDELN